MDEVYEKRKDIFFTNLLLLGFDLSYMEKKYGISFYKDMFDVPNQKAFEVVTHFLFSRLNEVTRDEYRILWPVLDKMQEREFMKTCKSHFAKIAKENSEFVRFPHVGQILMSPGGSHKFYELYMAFSSYVMQRIISRDRVCHQLRRPTLTASNHKDVREVLQLSTIITSREFVETQRSAVDCHNEWHETAQNFVSYYRSVKRQIVENQKLFKEGLESLLSTSLENGDIKLTDEKGFQAVFARSRELLQEVIQQWCELEESMKKEKPFWDVIKCALETECSEKITLDGNKYIFPIPDALKKNCRKELLEHGVQSLVEADKLSMRSFLNLCCVNVKHYDSLFKEDGLPDLDGAQAGVQTFVQKFENILEHITNLSKNILHNTLPDISEGKEKLENSVYSDVSEKETEVINKMLPSTDTILSSVSSEGHCCDGFKNILQLSPQSERKFVDSCHRKSKLLSMTVETNDYINRSAFKVLDRFPRYGLPTPSQLRSVHKSFSKSTYELSHQFTSQKRSRRELVFMKKEEPRLITKDTRLDEFMSNCNLDDSVISSVPHDLTLPHGRLRTYSEPNSFEISPDVNENCLDKVHKKFVEHLVSKYKKNSLGAASSDDDSFVFPLATETDVLGVTAFHHNEILSRTPPNDLDFNQEFKLQTKVAQSNSSKEISKENLILEATDIENYRRISWPDDDDFLENVTLPDLPI